jgi:hypothetical protein
VYLNEAGCEAAILTQPAQDRDQWWALENTAMSLRVP